MAVVACMDSRLDVFKVLGLNPGDAHVLRNAGGVVTDDMIRSLAISQRLLKTEEIVLVHHTDCGMLKLSEDTFREELRQETGFKPTWAVEAFVDLEDDVRHSMNRIQASPFLLHKDKVTGYIFDVDTLELRRVEPAA
nr:carbonic anhydrase [Conexibacter sp. SYSU D00693]